jgi:enoyl-CoA hydratase
MIDFETIRYASQAGIARITLARPERRNAIDAQMFVELGEAAELAGNDPDVRLVLVSGDGPSFCAGIDLSALSELAGVQGSSFRSFVRMAQRPFRRIARLGKPSVAAVQGHAIGAGFQLALACDLRVVARDATFAMLEARYGLIPDLGGSHHLSRIVGTARAKELVWTARTVEAEEAFAIGLANRLAEPGEHVHQAEALLEDLLRLPPIPQSLSKELIDRVPETPLEVQFEREAQAQGICLQSEDHREAVAAFLEKRDPTFSGR